MNKKINPKKDYYSEDLKKALNYTLLIIIIMWLLSLIINK